MLEVATRPVLRPEKREEVKIKLRIFSPFNYSEAISDSRIRLDGVIRQVNEKNNFYNKLFHE